MSNNNVALKQMPTENINQQPQQAQQPVVVYQTSGTGRYIYSVFPDGTLNPNFDSIQTNSYNDRLFNVGAPFYFYFGLKKGKSAFDRFTTKWLDTTTTI